MANSDKLASVVVAIAERDEEFRPLETAASVVGTDGEQSWSLHALKTLLGYANDDDVSGIVNRAKVAASKAGWSLKEHFVDGTLHDVPGDVFLSKYAAYLFVTGCDPEKERVAVALSFFAHQLDRQALEDEKRLKTRLDVATENRKLAGVAGDRGVENFSKFNGSGVSALYGGRTASQLAAMKRLPKGASYLDFAGSEELAANLFRITQTAAALKRESFRDENRACQVHAKVARGVRETIREAGNTLPENLPAAGEKIDSLASKTSKRLGAKPF